MRVFLSFMLVMCATLIFMDVELSASEIKVAYKIVSLDYNSPTPILKFTSKKYFKIANGFELFKKDISGYLQYHQNKIVQRNHRLKKYLNIMPVRTHLMMYNHIWYKKLKV